jgi:hypothetical protein
MRKMINRKRTHAAHHFLDNLLIFPSGPRFEGRNHLSNPGRGRMEIETMMPHEACRSFMEHQFEVLVEVSRDSVKAFRKTESSSGMGCLLRWAIPRLHQPASTVSGHFRWRTNDVLSRLVRRRKDPFLTQQVT